MANVDGKFYSGIKGRVGTTPESPNDLEGVQPFPVNPPGSNPSHDPVTIGTPANGLSIIGQELSLGLSSSSTTGALSDVDWSTFNGKLTDAPNDSLAYVRKSNAWAQLSPFDLKQEGATDGQALVWSAANSRYQPATVSGGGGTDSNAVHYNVSDGKTASERAQARSNIGSTASTPQIVATAGTINNLAYTSNCIVFTAGSAVTLTGLVAGEDGEEVTIVNYSGANLTIANNNGGSSVGNRFRGQIIVYRFGVSAIVKYRATLNAWVVQDRSLFYSDSANGFLTINPIAINVAPVSTIALNVRASGTTSGFTALFVTDSSGNQILNCNATRVVLVPFQLVAGTTALPSANVSFTVRGKGTTTGTMAEFYDSAATIRMRIRDSGDIDIYNMPTSDPLLAGRLWNDLGTVKISAG